MSGLSRLKYLARRFLDLPFREAVSKTLGFLKGSLREQISFAVDTVKTTYLLSTREDISLDLRLLGSILSRDTRDIASQRSMLDQIRAHRVCVLSDQPRDYSCSTYSSVNWSNRKKSRSLATMISDNHVPIAWGFDPLSGERWDVRVPSQRVRYGFSRQGPDVKRAWDFARGHHLVELSIIGQRNEFTAECRMVFRDEILDFIAHNPPRYGVNWCSTMDVAIRITNWLVAWDLLVTKGGAFDAQFSNVFYASVYAHGHHIYNHLEWVPVVRANHYLSNICGLAVVAAYTPPDRETNSWLRFAIDQLEQEVLLQFNEDGSNFEASTAYHRLCLEFVCYATSVVQGIELQRWNSVKDEIAEPAKPEIRFGEGWQKWRTNGSRFSDEYVKRLALAHGFLCATRFPDGTSLQIGDNDSGRFLGSLTGRVEPLDYSATRRAVQALYGADEVLSLEGALVRQLSRGRSLEGRLSSNEAPYKAYEDFGLYLWRLKNLFFAIRLGDVGQNGGGGHAHNDQLAFVAAFCGVTFFVDTGTGVYTANQDVRNRFRSTSAHNTVFVADREQQVWRDGWEGLFSLHQTAEYEIKTCDEHSFSGVLRYDDVEHERSIAIGPDVVKGCDSLSAPGRAFFHLHPEVRVERRTGCAFTLVRNTTCIDLRADVELEVMEAAYSEVYGHVTATRCIVTQHAVLKLNWEISVL